MFLNWNPGRIDIASSKVKKLYSFRVSDVITFTAEGTSFILLSDLVADITVISVRSYIKTK